MWVHKEWDGRYYRYSFPSSMRIRFIHFLGTFLLLLGLAGFLYISIQGWKEFHRQPPNWPDQIYLLMKIGGSLTIIVMGIWLRQYHLELYYDYPDQKLVVMRRWGLFERRMEYSVRDIHDLRIGLVAPLEERPEQYERIYPFMDRMGVLSLFIITPDGQSISVLSGYPRAILENLIEILKADLGLGETLSEKEGAEEETSREASVDQLAQCVKKLEGVTFHRHSSEDFDLFCEPIGFRGIVWFYFIASFAVFLMMGVILIVVHSPQNAGTIRAHYYVIPILLIIAVSLMYFGIKMATRHLKLSFRGRILTVAERSLFGGRTWHVRPEEVLDYQVTILATVNKRPLYGLVLLLPDKKSRRISHPRLYSSKLLLQSVGKVLVSGGRDEGLER